MSVNIGAPKQHKQPSRKGKRAWRKNVDITEVQDGLEALREEIIQTGSGPVSEQKAEDLFAVDIVGSEDVRRRIKSSKPLKVDEILAKRSAVPAVDSRKRSGSGLGDGILEAANKRQKKDWVSKKEVARLRQVANTTSHLGKSNDEEDHTSSGFDLWTTESPTISEQRAQTLDYIPQTRAKVAPSTLNRAPISMTASGKAVKAVQHPNAGTSYNPDFEQWNNLLMQEGDKELSSEQKRLNKEVEDAERQARIDAIANKDDYHPEEESAWEGFETDRSESTDALKAKRPERKTPAQRNKVKRRKEAERQAKHEAKMQSQQDRIVDLILSKKDENTDLQTTSSTANHDEDSSDDDATQLRRRRLGPSAIPTKNLELVLPDELQESLRQLKPEGNLLQDRFRNLLVNGKIESRKPVLQAKKKRVKVTEKWSYKDFEVSV